MLWEGCLVKIVKLHRRKFLHLAVGAAALPVVSRIARAQAYPTRPVRFIVPLAPGGGLDFVARLTAERMSRSLGQQVLVENKVGAVATSALRPLPRVRQMATRSW